MPTRVPQPEALHLTRLAKATPDEALELPGTGGALRALHLTRKQQADDMDCWIVCLAGEVLIDLPSNAFTHLRAGETCRVPADTPRSLTPVREATVLIVRQLT